LPYARNSRTHSEDQIGQIASSIKEFGFTNPILIDADNQIIAGHGRLMGANRLQMKEVPCIRLSHLTESQKRAYVIADNKLALNAGWDDELLALEIKDLQELDFDVSLLGFSEDELSAINEAANKNFEAATEEEQGKLDQLDPKWIDCPHCGKEFDARKS
jgi:ParB-like chromosome segregation protein Spo0J